MFLQYDVLWSSVLEITQGFILKSGGRPEHTQDVLRATLELCSRTLAHAQYCPTLSSLLLTITAVLLHTKQSTLGNMWTRSWSTWYQHRTRQYSYIGPSRDHVLP